MEFNAYFLILKYFLTLEMILKIFFSNIRNSFLMLENQFIILRNTTFSNISEFLILENMH